MLTKPARELLREGKTAEAIASTCDAIDALEARIEGIGEDMADRDGDLKPAPPPEPPQRPFIGQDADPDTPDYWHGGM